MRCFKFFFSITILVLIFLFLSPALFSQSNKAARKKQENSSYVTEEWSRVIDGGVNDTDYIGSIGVDNLGNVYLGGSQKSSISDYDFVIIKINELGSEIWKKTYNGSGNMKDKLVGLMVDQDNNIYVSGWTYEEKTYYDITTIKFSSAGEIIWKAKFNGLQNGNDIGGKLTFDTHGNVFVIGRNVIIKYDSSGNEQWNKNYGYDFTNGATDKDGNFFVTGSVLQAEKNTNFITIKFDQFGKENWISKFDGAGPGYTLDYSWETPNDITTDWKGNVYVTGQSIGITTGWDYVTIKYNSTGEEQWVKRHNGNVNFKNGSDQDISESIKVDFYGNVYVTGESSFSDTHSDYFTIKYDSSGTEQWSVRYDGGWAKDLILDFYGNCYVTGQHYIGKENSKCAISTIKYSNSGNQEWIGFYLSNKFDYCFGNIIAIDNIGNIYATGDCYDKTNSSDMILLKYSQAITENSNIISKSYADFTKRILSLRKEYNSLIKDLESSFPGKGEFETSDAFTSRLNEKTSKVNSIEVQYSIKINELENQRELEIEDLRKNIESVNLEKIEQSQKDTVVKISNVSSYNADKQTFAITIKGITKNVFISIDKAPRFKENWKKAKVKCKKQLSDDLKNYKYFDFIIIDPLTNKEIIFEDVNEKL